MFKLRLIQLVAFNQTMMVKLNFGYSDKPMEEESYVYSGAL